MKKRISLLLTMGLVLTTAGCGSPVSEPTQTTTTEVYTINSTDTSLSNQATSGASEENTVQDVANKAVCDSSTSDSAEKAAIPVIGINDDYWDDFEYEYEDEKPDQAIIDEYLALPKQEYDNAYIYEDGDWHGADRSLPLVKLAGFDKEEISVYGTNTDTVYGIIVCYKDQREYFPVTWGYGYSDPKAALTDIDDDGEKELVFIAMAIHGTGIYRDSLSVFKFKDDSIKLIAGLDNREMANELNKVIKFDADKHKVLLDNCINYQEIPLENYKESISDYDGTSELEIENICFVNGWYFEPAQNRVLMKVYIELGIKDNMIPACPYSNGEMMLPAEFELKLKDDSFYIVEK